MAQYLIKDDSLTAIGDAIRGKLGFSDKLTPAAMASYIRDHLGTGLASILDKNISYIYDTSMTSLKPYAFYDCNELHTAIFTEVEAIGENAFASCEKLSHFEAPKCSTVDANAFAGCTSVTSLNLGITSLTSTDAVGVVTYNNTNLITLNLSQASNIGEYAFNGCTNLTNVSLPMATSLGQYTFNKCYSLTSMYLPKVTYAGHYVFSNCSNIKRIDMPLCSYFGKHAFQNCTGLKELIVPAWNSSHTSGVFDTVAECPIETLAFGFASSPTTFSAHATLKNVSMPTTTYITANTFNKCYALENIYAPVASTIGNTAFANCSALSSFTFPEVELIGVQAFLAASSLTELTSEYFPNENLALQNSAFANCSNLTYVNLPLKSMSSYAFMGCTSLEEVIMPNLQSTLLQPFSGCIRLSYMQFDTLPTIADTTFTGQAALQTVILPACTKIGRAAFQACSSLTSISAPNVTSITGQAFVNCYALEEVHFPLLSSLETNVFNNCSALKVIDTPVCTAYYSAAARYPWVNANALESVNIGSMTLATGTGLSNKVSLKTIRMPMTSQVTARAFEGCKALENVTITACTSMHNRAFQNCISLSQFTMPTGITTISASTFSGCSALMSLYLPCSSVVTLAGTNAFTNTPMSLSTFTGTFGSIYVPASLYKSYIAATNWTTYSARIVSVSASNYIGFKYASTSYYLKGRVPFGYTWREVMDGNIPFNTTIFSSPKNYYITSYISLSTDGYTPMIGNTLIPEAHIDDYVILGKNYL